MRFTKSNIENWSSTFYDKISKSDMAKYLHLKLWGRFLEYMEQRQADGPYSAPSLDLVATVESALEDYVQERILEAKKTQPLNDIESLRNEFEKDYKITPRPSPNSHADTWYKYILSKFDRFIERKGTTIYENLFAFKGVYFIPLPGQDSERVRSSLRTIEDAFTTVKEC